MPSGTTAGKERKRRVVAAGKLAGQTTEQIASSAGCKSRHVQRLAQEEETQFLIKDMMRPHRDSLEALAGMAIKAVRLALGAKDGRKADHMARLRAVGRYAQLCELAQGGKAPDLPPDDGGLMTYEELTLIIQSRTVTVEAR
jgi:hypothetical protein